MSQQTSPWARLGRIFQAVGVAAIFSSACADDGAGLENETESTTASPPSNIDVRRSLVVTEEAALAGFALQRVMDQLAAQSGVSGLTGIELFRQWWDTQNPAPGLSLGAHCDDHLDPTYGSAINGFPYDCRPAPSEGAQASCTSFSDPACGYTPIGLFNRFDLAPPDGAHCGEYRIVYAKTSGQTNERDRNLIIFEAALVNPRPAEKLAGCLPVVQLWASLTSVPDIGARAMRLEQFYFGGTAYFGPVVQIANFGANALGAGQIRTNQFMDPTSPFIWTLREFKLQNTCAGAVCRPRLVPVTNKVNPYGPLFATTSMDPRAASFQSGFVNEVPALTALEVPDISMATADVFNTAQSHASQSDEMRYLLHFGADPTPFRANLQSALTARGSSLTPEQVIARAATQSCAGCHQLSNNVDLGGGKSWPPSLGFVHVSERDPELVSGVGRRFRISSALLNSFLPVRKQVMDDYLKGRPLRVRGRGQTIGGRVTH